MEFKKETVKIIKSIFTYDTEYPINFNQHLYEYPEF